MIRRFLHRLDHFAYSAIARLSPRMVDAVYRGPTDRKRIALTFDDGPSPNNTLRIAKLLAHYGARGTFFVSGAEVEGMEDVLRGLAADGHEIGNHTFAHARAHELPLAELRADVERTSELVLGATGRQPQLVRPPYGKDCRRMARLGRELGFQTILWSVDSGDTRGWTATEIVEHVTQRVRPGSIVLMHDGGEFRPATLGALERLVPDLRARGYELVTVSELLAS